MPRSGLLLRIVAAVVAVALTAFSLGFTWAVVDDYAQREIVPKGATVEGVPVGGLTRAEAVRVVGRKVTALLLSPVELEFKGQAFTLDASAFLSVDTEGMVADTFRPKEVATLTERVFRRITGKSVQADVTRKLKLDTEGLKAWIARTASQIDTRPIDTTITVANDRLRFSKSVLGYRLNRRKTLEVLSTALMDGQRDVEMKIDPVKPRFSEANLGKSILVVKSARHLWLYNGTKVEKEYPVAVGTPGYPTPSGWWVIENKRYRPTWTNPGSGWAKGMPSYIGPGYYNPLGTRALDLNASGIRIHGSAKDWSIGTAASHGCMRMHMPDIEELYELVPVGTRVVIIP